MEDEILNELWAVKDELSEKANRVGKTELQTLELRRMETELRQLPHVVHDPVQHAHEIHMLKKDRALSLAYLKAAIEALDDVDMRLGGLLTFFTVAEAYEDMMSLATEAGVGEEPLYQMLAATPIPHYKEKAGYLAWFDRQLEEFNGRAHAQR